MEEVVLSASLRTEKGKGAARKARANGRTPGVMYSAAKKGIPVTFDLGALAAIFRKSNDPNTVVTLDLDGARHTCLVREVQRHPVTRVVEHVDFHPVGSDDRVQVEVAIVTQGKAAGTRAGGTLRLLARKVRVDASAHAIPKQIDVDVTPLEVGQILKASQMVAPEGVKFVYKQDFNVVTVEGKRQSKAEEAAAAAAAATGDKKGKK
jgi:large subunit ribosomal protein L25